jgi:hypothetical protein
MRQIKAGRLILSKRASAKPTWGRVAGGLSVLFVCFILSGSFLPLSALSMVCFAPILLLAIGTFCGVAYAIRISGAIVNEHTQGRYELAQVSPLGAEGVSWSVGNLAYHNSHFVGQIRDLARGIYLVIGVGVTMLIGMNVILWIPLIANHSGPISGREMLDQAEFIVPFFVVVSAIYLDLIQSILVGYVIGLIVPTMTVDRLNARGLASGLFLGVQFSFYAIVGILSFWILPEFYALLGFESGAMLNLIRLALFFGLRETLIVVLWRLLATTLDTNIGELDITAGLTT